ncbi:glycosyltransferase family 4 protein [Sulfurovum sp. NBC37-1]|uniref:glycosyltransferase family 4 protein n=1 Tax=Sulfurovum sp. (strain NBC37-1) TaxID=387093 RepID=UPI0001587B5D|nr:glycosyltransferase family 4 protein [Sulfurovum sp. NBC37-1]BAF72482.1 hypothetical protein SUN_1531 [Sulfurovum sp. NBC37-1]
MTKVLIYSPTHTNVWGGGQIYIEQLCRYMNEKGVETYILSSNPDSFNVPTLPMPIAHPKWRRFTSAFGLAKHYKGEGFNTIILNDLASLWLAPIFKLYGYRVISLLLNYLQRRSENPLGHSEVEYRLLKWSAYFCDNMFSVDKNNQKIFGKDRVVFVGNYVPDWFWDIPEKVNTKDKYDFLLLARFAKQKNIPLFLEILHNSHKLGKKYSALIVGDGPERENILDMIEKYGLKDSITIEGWVSREELPNVYDRGKCFVISSLHEGFATTLLESHARGLPAIVTKSSGFCGEFVEGYGASTGFVFEPDDLKRDSFYNKVSKLIAEYESYGEKCRKKAKVFTEENVLGEILNTVNDIDRADVR